MTARSTKWERRMSSMYYGCKEYELEVQRMIYEGGGVFQDSLLIDRREQGEKKSSEQEG